MSHISKKCDILTLIKIKILSDFDLSMCIYITLYYIFYDKILFFFNILCLFFNYYF